MDPKTGEIQVFASEKAAAAAGFTIMLTPEQARSLLAMSRHERRVWLSQQLRSENLHRIVEQDDRRRESSSTTASRLAELEEELASTKP